MLPRRLSTTGTRDRRAERPITTSLDTIAVAITRPIDPRRGESLERQRLYVLKPDGYVFAVFRTRCVRFLESRRRRNEVAVDRYPEGRPANPMGAELFNRQVALRQALALITSTCRRLLSAYYVEGEDLREVSRRLSMTHGSASTTLSRCLKKLRRYLL